MPLIVAEVYFDEADSLREDFEEHYKSFMESRKAENCGTTAGTYPWPRLWLYDVHHQGLCMRKLLSSIQ